MQYSLNANRFGVKKVKFILHFMLKVWHYLLPLLNERFTKFIWQKNAFQECMFCFIKNWKKMERIYKKKLFIKWNGDHELTHKRLRCFKCFKFCKFFLRYFGSPFSVTETNFPSWTRIPSQRERERGVVLGTDRERKDVGGERESNGVKAKSFVKGLKLVMCISYN